MSPEECAERRVREHHAQLCQNILKDARLAGAQRWAEALLSILNVAGPVRGELWMHSTVGHTAQPGYIFTGGGNKHKGLGPVFVSCFHHTDGRAVAVAMSDDPGDASWRSCREMSERIAAGLV